MFAGTEENAKVMQNLQKSWAVIEQNLDVTNPDHPGLFLFRYTVHVRIPNPVALRTPKTLCSFGCSECSRVKVTAMKIVDFSTV